MEAMWWTTGEHRKHTIPLTHEDCFLDSRKGFWERKLHICFQEESKGTNCRQLTQTILAGVTTGTFFNMFMNLDPKLLTSSFHAIRTGHSAKSSGSHTLAPIYQHRKKLTYTPSFALFSVQTACQLSQLALGRPELVYQLRWEWKRACTC